MALQNYQNVCGTILKYAVSIIGTRIKVHAVLQSPARFPKMGPECGLPILQYVTYHSSLHFEWWPIDQGSTVNTANDNKKLLPLQAAPTTGKSTPVVNSMGCLTRPDAEITGRPTQKKKFLPCMRGPSYPVTMVTCFWGERRLMLG